MYSQRFIRFVAGAIYVLRLRTLQQSDVRFLVFTGTSGKTLARSVTAYALRRAGHIVVSPPFGYTNELGIVLAALGIESTRLFSWSGIWTLFTSQPPVGAFICIELGADFRDDTRWFLERFKPFGIIITNLSREAWARLPAEAWGDKERLFDAVPSNGFVCWSAQNESIGTIRNHFLAVRDFRSREIVCDPWKSGEGVVYKIENGDRMFGAPFVLSLPYVDAFGLALACLQLIDALPARGDFFSAFTPPPGRLSMQRIPSGPLLVHDTYKSVPQCMCFVLTTAAEIPAQKRIAVVSSMHPLLIDQDAHYQKMADILRAFDTVYYIGPRRIQSFLQKSIPTLRAVRDASEYSAIARTILSDIDERSVIVVKGAGRYRLDTLVELLTLNGADVSVR